MSKKGTKKSTLIKRKSRQRGRVPRKGGGVLQKPSVASESKAERFLHIEGVSDKLLLGGIVTLTMFGLLMIASAGVIYANERFDDPYYFFKRQVIGVVIGMIALLILERIDYHFFRKWSLFIFLGATVLLILVLIPGLGVDVNGATRWISVGSITIQPAEAVKLAMILYISAWCSAKGAKRIADTTEGFVPFLTIVGSVCFLIILQPDVGTMSVIVLIAMSIFFVAGAKLKHLGIMVLMGIALLLSLIKAAPYRMQRLLTFLNPEQDLQGAGYHISQAAIAIGSGGLLGLGLGHSRQKGLFLPEPVGDSIFAIIAEEFGFLGSVIFVGLIIFIAWRIFEIAKNAPDLFGRLVATGVGVWLIGQAFMNIAAISGLMPLTGIPLSFVSYGGTSMVVALAAVGILLNISRQSKP